MERQYADVADEQTFVLTEIMPHRGWTYLCDRLKVIGTVHLITDYDNGMCYDHVATCSIFFKD